MLPDEKGKTAAEFWHRAVAFFATHGITIIHRCLTDNGSCYRSNLWRDALAATGTKLRRRPYDSEQDRVDALATFLNYYNHEHRHSALGWFPPVTRAPGPDGLRVEAQVNQNELAEVTDEQMSIYDELL